MSNSWLALVLLAAACGGGSAPAAPSGPTPPASLVATAANRSVSLTWTAVDGASSYLVFRQASTEPQPSQIANPTTTSLVDTAVTNGVTYLYTVRAVTPLGTSGNSPSAQATPSRLLCVSDLIGDRVLMFAADAANPTTPPGFGSSTKLRPFDVDVDPVHAEIFSANGDTVTTHAATANGNVPPLRSFDATTGADAVGYDSESDTLLVADNVGAVLTFPRASSAFGLERSLSTKTQISQIKTSGAAHGDRMFVKTFNDSRILVYNRTDVGDAPPVAVISPAATVVGGIAYDPGSDQILAAVATATGAAIQAFPASGTSSVPVRVLQGDQTGFGSLTAITLDPVTRRLYVADSAQRVSVFSADFAATANVAPSLVLAGPATQFLGTPIGSMAVDPVRGVLIVQVLTRVLTFAETASGNAPPISAISSVSSGIERPFGMTFDPDRKEILVANSGPQLTVSAFPTSGLPAAPAVARILDVPSNLFVARPGIAVDAVHDEMFTYAGSAILVYRRGAVGSEPALRTIAGASTQLLAIQDIAYDSANDALVVNDNGSTIRRYARTAQGDVAPITSLTVPEGGFPIAVDNAHGELFAAVTSGVAVYHLTDSGQATPIRTLSGLTGVNGLMIDPSTDQLYVISSFGSDIQVYARTTSGTDAPLRALNQHNAFVVEGSGMALCN